MSNIESLEVGVPSPVAAPASTRVEVVRPFAPRPKPQRSYWKAAVFGPIVGKIPLSRLMFFFRQLGTMLRAGVPVVQALTTLAGQSRNRKLEMIVLEMAQLAQRGVPISVTMTKYPEVFTPIMLGMVRAGEAGGFLDQALRQTATYIEQEISLRNLYKRITFMPKLQVLVSVIIILATNAIIDSIRKDSQHLDSPLTQVATWYWLAPLIASVFLFLRVGLANRKIKYVWDAIMIRIPGIGTLIREVASAKFGRAFGALYRGGLPLGRSLTMAADATGNEYMRSRIYPMAPRLEAGVGIARTFREAAVFSPVVIDMIATGETTGEVEEMLTKMSEFYEDEAVTKSTKVANVTGVLIALAVGIYIGFIVISFWSDYAKGISTELG